MEIERKFLVKGDFFSTATSNTKIAQGYLSSVPERTVRVRIRDEQAYLTIKGISNASGMSRYEWEKEILVSEAQELLSLCEAGVITKTRYLVPEPSGLVFEVDVFEGSHQGLVLAEIELPTEDTPFEKPSWLGEEVTGQKEYYNSYLSKQ